MSKQQYTIDILAEAGNDPFTGNQRPEQRESVTIEAATLEEARKHAPVFMRMTVRGQMLRFFHNGTELLGNF